MAKQKQEIPNYIHCSITGKRFAVRRDVLIQRMKAAGGLERLKKTYVSREARKLLKSGKSIDAVREELGCDEEYANMALTDRAAKTSSSMAKVRIQQGESFHAFWREAGWVTPKSGESLGRPMTPTEISKSTEEACMFPNRHADKDCHNCRVFTLCRLLTKGVYRK